MSVIPFVRPDSPAASPAARPMAEPVANAAIDVRGLSLHYGNQAAFTGVDLDVPRGSITAMIGPSGCGKTSFLNCLNRLTDLIPTARVSGQARVDDVDIMDDTVDRLALRRAVGMIFQKPNPLPMSIRRNIDLPLREHGVRDASQREATIRESLEAAGLWGEVADRLDASALQLSGGQRQRLCIARAIALQPRVLLMDEPCSALDPIASGAVEALITSLRERFTVLIVTHNLAQARRIADHVAVFWTHEGAGCLVEHGTAEDVFERPQHAITAAYLDGRCC